MSDRSQPNIGNDDDVSEQATKGNKADKSEVTTVAVETEEEEKTKDSKMESPKKAEAKPSNLIASLYEDSPPESSDDNEDVSPATKKQRVGLRDRRDAQTGYKHLFVTEKGEEAHGRPDSKVYPRKTEFAADADYECLEKDFEFEIVKAGQWRMNKMKELEEVKAAILGHTGRSGYSVDAVEAMRACISALQKKYKTTMFDERTVLCLLPAIRFAKGSTIPQLMNAYKIYGYLVDAVNDCKSVTKTEFPFLHSLKFDKGKKAGSAVSKVLTSVNQRKAAIFVVRVHYFVHVWNSNVEPNRNQKPFEYDFETFPTLQEIFTDFETSLEQKEEQHSWKETKPGKAKFDKNREGMAAITNCQVKLKTLHKTTEKLNLLFPLLKKQIDEANDALGESEAAIAAAVNLFEKKETKAKLSKKKKSIDQIFKSFKNDDSTEATEASD